MTELAQENSSSSGGLLSDMPSHDGSSTEGHDMPQEMTDPPSHDAGEAGVLADPAQAHMSEEQTTSTEHAGGSAGMPQLDPQTYPSQLFWLGVTFIAMYVLMSRSVLPRISEVLENRRTRREGDLALADSLTREAQEAKAAYESLFLEAKNGANQLIADVQASVQAMEDKETAQLDKTLAEKLQKADVSIRVASEDARERLTPVIAELASEVVKSIVGKAPSDAQLKAAAKHLS